MEVTAPRYLNSNNKNKQQYGADEYADEAEDNDHDPRHPDENDQYVEKEEVVQKVRKPRRALMDYDYDDDGGT
jgi:hypothetical protein